MNLKKYIKNCIQKLASPILRYHVKSILNYPTMRTISRYDRTCGGRAIAPREGDDGDRAIAPREGDNSNRAIAQREGDDSNRAIAPREGDDGGRAIAPREGDDSSREISCCQEDVSKEIDSKETETKETETKKAIAQCEDTGANGSGAGFGINLIGPVRSSTGLGQSFRLLEREFRELGVKYTIIPFEGTINHSETEFGYEDRISDHLIYDISLWHVSPTEGCAAFKHFGREAFEGHYNIAFWLWETEDFPEEWVPLMNLFEEIWTPSEFISTTLRKTVEIYKNRLVNSPLIYTIPYAIEAKLDLEKYNRSHFGLPDNETLFLVMYDAFSTGERKNPEAAIRAFLKAFGEGNENPAGGRIVESKEMCSGDKQTEKSDRQTEKSDRQTEKSDKQTEKSDRQIKISDKQIEEADCSVANINKQDGSNSLPGLVIKIGSADEAAKKKLHDMTDGYGKVYFIDQKLTKIEVNSLISDVDVFVSLHRAEGFGLVMAEAMLSGTVCVATNWSANTEFMNQDTACMVDAKLVSLEKLVPPYKKGTKWAEPDENQAAYYMKKLMDKDYYNDLRESGRESITRVLGMEQAVAKIDVRLQNIKKG